MPEVSSAKYIVELNDPEAFKSASVGSKAASVADLVRSGAAVPRGFAIHTKAFDEFIEPTRGEIAEILASVDTDNAVSAFVASDSINALLDSHALPEGLISEVTDRVGLITAPSNGSVPKSLAVRSSATTEDLENASFAGMYDTFLDGTDANSVLAHVRDVWASYYAGRAISYRQRMGVPHEAGSMGVLVMELVDSEAGGVVFTRDPRDGKEQILVNVALGLGEGVVSGETEADSFTIDPESHEITSRNVIDKDWMIVSGSTGTIERIPVPANRRSKPVLIDDQLLAVAEAASVIKKAAGGDDRDIEFAIANGTVHILQSRPITTGTEPETEFPVVWDVPSEAKHYWTSAFRPEPTIPLFIDLLFMASDAEKRCVEATGQHMARRYLKKVFNGHVFAAAPVNATEKADAQLFKHHLQGRRLLDKRTTYYYEEIEPLLVAGVAELERVRPASDAPLPELIANLRVTTRAAADHEADLHWRGWAGFKEQGTLNTLFGEITGKPDIEASTLTAGLDHMTSRLIGRLIGIGTLVKSDEWLSGVFEKRTYDAIFEHGAGKRPAVRRFRRRFRSMMRIWGQRNGTGYGTAWSPEDPTWNMKPEIVLDSIGSYTRQDLDQLMQKQANIKRERVLAIRTVRQQIGRDKKLRKQFEHELYKATEHIKMMENHNYLIEQRTIGEYRESINRVGTALVNGGWIETADDVFYMRLAQMEAAADNDDYSSLGLVVIQAKNEITENANLKPPEFLGTKPPEKEDDKKDDEEQPLRGPSEDGLLLHGEPSSPGSFTGTARVVITRTSTPPNVKKGDILVTENTGPDWVPVFPLLGALILDSGANFQHASLICREYGIPCVIQTKEATALIADGQVITVDGTAGTVVLNPLL